MDAAAGQKVPGPCAPTHRRPDWGAHNPVVYALCPIVLFPRCNSPLAAGPVLCYTGLHANRTTDTSKRAGAQPGALVHRHPFQPARPRTGGSLRRQVVHELVTYQFDHPAFAGIEHAVFTRLGGVSRGALASLNVGRSVGDDPAAVSENLRRIYAHLGLAAGQVVTPWQVHSNRIAVVSGHDAEQIVPNTDGLVTATPGLALLLRFADCQPILLYDPEHHALGLVHAGWRGVAQGVAIRAVEAMQASFGTRPRALIAGLGPAIGPCCYVVGDEVAAAM
ncbi:MAG: laccase domain-containing protein, partial [Chloroflexi bacterium]